MPRQRMVTYVARTWEEGVQCAAHDAVKNGWTIADWHWEEPKHDLLGVLFVTVEEPALH